MEVLGPLTPWLGLTLVGFSVGVYGTVVGAGGGFVLVPLLLLLYPREESGVITSISLAVVCLNAFSGSLAYASQRRIDYRSVLALGAVAVPAAVAGALTTHLLPRGLFDRLLGLLLMSLALYLVARPAPAVVTTGWRPRYTRRVLTDAAGNTFMYAFDLRKGMLLAGAIEFLAILFGVGGGPFVVSMLTQVLLFPVHVAAATSLSILLLTSFTATVTHLATGSFTRGVRRTTALGLGVLLGAQVGAALSRRLGGGLIVRLLAGALALVGLRLVVWG